MKLTLLGTGTPAPSLRRQSSGYLVEIGDDVLVFDHGPGAHQRLLESGHQASDVTHLFFTHFHYDHVMDFPRLILTRWDHGGTTVPRLKVFGPPPLEELNERFFGANGAFAYDISARTDSPASIAVYRARGGEGERPRPEHDLREVQPGDRVEGANWTVTAGPVRHVQPSLNCLGYRIESGDGCVVYSGDNGGVFSPFIDFARGCDVLIHMNHFLSGTELTDDYRQQTGSHLDVAETARQAEARTLVLTHLLPQLDQPGVKERMLAEMAGVFKGTIIVGEDLMTVPIHIPTAAAAAD